MPEYSPKKIEKSAAAAERRVDADGPERAWLAELEAQHRSLDGVLSALIDRVDRIPRAVDRLDVHDELLRLIADADLLLRAHFAFEEAGGHLGDALAIAPRLSHRAAHLEGDHEEFTANFAKIAV